MTTIDNILSVIDPASEDQPGFERAAWLAARLGASLDLFVNVYEPFVAAIRVIDPVGSKDLMSRLLDDHRVALEALAESAEKEGVTVRTDVRWDHPSDEAILRKARDCDASLVVKDTRYHAASRRAFSTASDWSLIRNCPVPLLLVKPRAVSASASIVAAVDPSHDGDERTGVDHAILSTAGELAAGIDGKLTAFHSYYSAAAVAEAVKLSPPLNVDLDRVVELERRRHRDAMNALMSAHSKLVAETVIHDGHAHDGLLGVAIDAKADFIVMGSAARGRSGHRSIGSLTERVLDHLPCDVVLVKPPGFSFPGDQ